MLIFDLGGGSFDVSIASVNEGTIEILASHGDCQLGGRDLDEALVNYCIDEYKR